MKLIFILLVLTTFSTNAIEIRADRLVITGYDALVCSETSCDAMSEDAAKALLKRTLRGEIDSPKRAVQSDTSDTRTTQRRYETTTEVVIEVTIEYMDAQGNVIDVQNHTFRFKKPDVKDR